MKDIPLPWWREVKTFTSPPGEDDSPSSPLGGRREGKLSSPRDGGMKARIKMRQKCTEQYVSWHFSVCKRQFLGRSEDRCTCPPRRRDERLSLLPWGGVPRGEKSDEDSPHRGEKTHEQSSCRGGMKDFHFSPWGG